jgi:hypothetical protein
MLYVQPLSKDDLEWVAHRLRLKISADDIVAQNHERYISEFSKGKVFASKEEELAAFLASGPPRGFYITTKTVYNVKKTHIDIEWKLHPDAQLSVQHWFYRLKPQDQLVLSLAKPIEGTPDHAQLQEHGHKSKFAWDPANWTPFAVAFCFAASRQAAVRCNGKPVQMDATHGTNSQQSPLTTLLGVDEHGNGRPLSWMVSNTTSAVCIAAFLRAFNDRVSHM